MKKILALVLSLIMLASVCSFASAEGYNMPEMNTTDEITLTFMTWDDFEMTEALAAKFMEKYPNIKVEVLRTTTADIAGELLNRAATNDLPDVYFWLDLEPLMAGKYMYDITEYIENDEEAQTMLYDTLKRVGYLDGQRCYFMAGEFLPATVYCDANVFEKMNVELPSQNWTWEEMLDLIDKLADPSQGYWGHFGGMYSYVTGGPIALTDNAIGEFGWNGEQYDFASGWVDSVETQIENLRLGKDLDVASPEYQALNLGDEWGGQTGHVGIVTDAFWTLNNIYSKPICTDRGTKMIPYNPPVGADAENAGQLGFLDFFSISATCEHPREAYELAKFLTWGKEGWMERIQLFPTLTWESTGEKAYDVPNCLPMITDEEVVNAYIAIMPDLGYWNDWAAFMGGIQNPVTWGSRSIPGFASFVNNYYHGSDYNGTVGIENAIREGTVDPYDYTDKLAEAGRQYYDEAMAVFYGVYGQPE